MEQLRGHHDPERPETGNRGPGTGRRFVNASSRAPTMTHLAVRIANDPSMSDCSEFPDFRGLRVWQVATRLSGVCFRIVDSTPRRLTRGIADQLLRAANSVTANIAEGKGRISDREYARYLDIAFGSLREVRSHLYDLHLARGLDTSEVHHALALCEDCSKMLTGLRRSIE